MSKPNDEERDRYIKDIRILEHAMVNSNLVSDLNHGHIMHMKGELLPSAYNLQTTRASKSNRNSS